MRRPFLHTCAFYLTGTTQWGFEWELNWYEVKKVMSEFRPDGPSGRPLSPVSVEWSDYEYFYSPLDGMLVHRRATPSIKLTGTHLYTWVERGTVRVKCLTQEHNTMSPARADMKCSEMVENESKI